MKWPVCFLLGLRGEPSILRVAGTVTWREGDAVGISFDDDTAANAPSSSASCAATWTRGGRGSGAPDQVRFDEAA